jgi:hypothetical protein
MRVWLGLLLVTGCNFADVGNDTPAEPTEPVAVEEAAVKVFTICADEVARELDPTIDTEIQDSLLYWQGEPGVESLRWSDSGDCDVPVYFSDESHFSGTQGARAKIHGKWESECSPVHIELREAQWDRALANDWTFVIIAHEVGHLLCKRHEEHGVMSANGGLTAD